MITWLEFLVVTGLILYSGSRLSRFGDMIAEKTGLSRLWLGMVLMAAVTSLPELVTGLNSVIVAGLPDIAAGDILGSYVFNLFLLSILDALSKKVPLASRAHQGNVLTAGIFLLLLAAVEKQHLIAVMSAVAMTGLAVAGLIYRSPKKRFPLSWDTFGIFLVFVVNMVLLYILR